MLMFKPVFSESSYRFYKIPAAPGKGYRKASQRWLIRVRAEEAQTAGGVFQKMIMADKQMEKEERKAVFPRGIINNA